METSGGGGWRTLHSVAEYSDISTIITRIRTARGKELPIKTALGYEVCVEEWGVSSGPY